MVIFILLYFFSPTVSPGKHVHKEGEAPHGTVNQSIKFEDLLVKAKERITPEQVARLGALENSVVRGDINEQKIHVYHQLARFWADSARIFEPYAWYTGEAAKLENSEKSLTFAAHLFLDNLMTEGEPAMQNWLASQAKVLFDQALSINPANDSSKIGLGACYLFGNISDNPMQGILKIREVVEKDPGNVFGQMMLGLGSKKSGQYDKAIERFLNVLKVDPENLDAIFNLAESYDIHNEKANAIKWYEEAKKRVAIPEAKQALEKRIAELKR
nr:tetratricopeptide repeat protein [Sediminibacterium sp. Gen4]